MHHQLSLHVPFHHFHRRGRFQQRLRLHRLIQRDGWRRFALRGAARKCHGYGHQQGQKYVLVVDAKNTVEFRPVKLGAPQEGGLRVVRSGLTTADRIMLRTNTANLLTAQLYVALDQRYVSPERFAALQAKAKDARRLIGGFMTYLRRSPLRGSKFTSARKARES